MKKVVSMIVLTAAIFGAYGQDKLPATFEIKSDTSALTYHDAARSDKYWQKLEDYTGTYGIGQVSKPPLSEQFHFNGSSKFSLLIKAYWYRYRVQNTMNKPISLAISTSGGYCDLYVQNAAGRRHYQTGWLLPWSKRDGLKAFRAILLTLKPGELALIYQREMITPFWHMSTLYASPDGFNLKDRAVLDLYTDSDVFLTYYPMIYIVIGVTLLTAIFNLFFFRVAREKLYLLFSLMMISYAVNRFFDGLNPIASGTNFPFFREFPMFANIAFFISYDLAFLYFFRFSRYFLDIPSYYLRWNAFLKGLEYYFLFIIVAPFLTPILTEGINQLITALQLVMRDLAIILIAFTYFLFVVIKNPARQGAVWVLPFLMMRMIAPALDTHYFLLPLIFGSFPQEWDTVILVAPLVEFLSISVMVLFFSYTLFQRFRLMQAKIATQALERELERSQFIEQQKIELEKQVIDRTAMLEQSLSNLKATQTQLIQSEKMASLGELTAGIAHEIQNPLNFVNNFSEVNREMLQELKAESRKSKAERDEQIETGLIDDLIDNEQKINHHGKRADAIVKAMLQHSRSSSGQREPTNINTLADEYLRLAYHGLRAKDKSFNAITETHFDKSIGELNINPQDIGRVILNLLNNAFYAVNEKKKLLPEGYEPTVTVSTKKLDDRIEVVVRDNGDGIPSGVLEKIYHPFFTTKPTGQGTGLGLSMSYDIIKAHGGELRVETKEGEFTDFTIQLQAT